MTLILELQDESDWPNTPSHQQFVTWSNAAVSDQALLTEVTIRLVSISESAALNKCYRNKVGPTNVLSFHYAQMPGIEDDYLGDIVLCAELIADQAQQEKKPLVAHWAHLTVHGMLHLQGYDHLNPKQAQHMEQREITILTQLGFANPYHDGASINDA